MGITTQNKWSNIGNESRQREPQWDAGALKCRDLNKREKRNNILSHLRRRSFQTCEWVVEDVSQPWSELTKSGNSRLLSQHQYFSPSQASASAPQWCHVESDVWLQRAEIIFANGRERGWNGPAKAAWSDALTRPRSLLFPFVTENFRLMMSVSGGAFSDAVGPAAKSFSWFTAVLF